MRKMSCRMSTLFLTGTLIAAVVTAGGCLLGGAGPAGLRDEPEEYPIFWEYAGHDARIRRGFQYVAYSAKDLARLPLVAPRVDLATQMVLIVSPGPVRSKDTTIRIRRIWREGYRLRCEIELAQSDTGKEKPTKLYSPYHLVVVPKSSRNIEGFTTKLPKGAFVSGSTG